MLAALTVLLVFQLAGETIVQVLNVPVPGPVVGMLLLFLALLYRGSVPPALRSAANGILEHLSLLFVPAGVGVMLHVHRIANEWLAISLAIVGSTLVTIGVTALVLKALERLKGNTPPAGSEK
jgi:holin-like protein